MRENPNATRGGLEIDLQKLLWAYMKRWWMFLVGGLLAAVIALVVTANFVTPTYRASVTVYVNNVSAGQQIEYISSTNLATAQRLVNTYVNIIESDAVLTDVAEKGNLPYSPDELRSMMSAAQKDETEIFTVSITHTDPVMAAKVANTIADVAPEKIGGIVEGSSTKIIDYANVPTAPSSPNVMKSVVLGALIGIVLALIYVTILFLLDVRVKDAEDLESIFDYPVLGQIPVFAVADMKKKSGYGYGANNETKERGGARA